MKKVAVTMVLLLSGLAVGEETSHKPAFVANDKGEYTFDTGVLRGTLRQGGKSLGLAPLIHIPTGARLDRSMGILSFYRVFTTGKRYSAGAWDWPSTAKLLPDGAVQVTWPAAADRPFEMGALYRWKDPQTIDLETTVTARQDVRGFESFLASYFGEAFPTPCVYVRENPEAQGKPALLPARKSYGEWQMFPRDDQVLPLIRDGRWGLQPNPVNWTIMPRLAAPLALRRGAGGGLVAVLMAPPEECFAIATPFEGEGHYSLYFSRFGRDLKSGETAKARTRLTIAPDISDRQALMLHREYMKGLSANESGRAPKQGAPTSIRPRPPLPRDESSYREVFQPDGTHVSGTIHGVVIWTASASPYVMERTVLVAEDGVLVVTPGVTVKVARLTEDTALIDAYMGLDVRGTLRAEGRPDAMIQFTCASDHPTPYREWRGIEIQRDASPSILRWVRVEHAIFGIDAYGPALVSHCVFWKCHSGIHLEADFTGDIRHNVSAYNAYSGIRCKGTRAEATITDNIFYANGDGIDAWADAVAYADYNLYWSSNPGNAPRHYTGMAPGPHDRIADPRFADPQKGNFGLPGDSPAVGAGSSNGNMGLDTEGWTERIREKEDREWFSDGARALWCEGLQIEHGTGPAMAQRYSKGAQDRPSAVERYREAMDRAGTPELKDKIACSLARVLATQKQYAEAVTLLEPVISGSTQASLRDLARCVLAETRPREGKPDEAIRIVGTVEWPQSQIWVKPALARYSVLTRDYQEALRTLAGMKGQDPYRYVKTMTDMISSALSADQIDGAITLMRAFEEYPLATERSAAYLNIAKAAHRLQRPQVAADLLRQGVNNDPFGPVAPESLSLLGTILEKELDRPAEAREVWTRLCTGYCPYDRYALQAAEKVRVARPDPNHTILLDASLGEASIFDRYPLGPCNFGQFDVIRLLSQAGYTVHANNPRAGGGRGQQALTPEALRLYGLVVLNLRYGGVAEPPIPPDVIKVFVNYVEAGGSLLVVASGRELGAGKTGQYYNPLLEPFGLRFEPEVSLSNTNARATNHPAMKNLSTFRQIHGVPVRVRDGAVLALVDDHPVIGLARYGKGRAIAAGIGPVFVGDMLSGQAMGNEGESEANRKLLVNLVSHVLNPRDDQGSTQTTMSNH